MSLLLSFINNFKTQVLALLMLNTDAQVIIFPLVLIYSLGFHDTNVKSAFYKKIRLSSNTSKCFNVVIIKSFCLSVMINSGFDN